MGRLQGRVALVTGGGRGIGRGICRRFAREGARVVVADVAEEEATAVAGELEELGGAGQFIKTDVTKKVDVEAAVSCAVESFGGIDVLVNNAIALSPHVELERKTDQMFAFALQVGFYPTLWAMRAAFPHMKAQGWGRIVNFYSTDASVGQWMHGDYNSSKGAVHALTISAAAEWGRYNVLCNIIAPVAAGSGFQALVERVPEVARRAREHPLGRMGDPETDIAPVVAFLASDDAQYVNGQMINVDGGYYLNRGGFYVADEPDVVDRWVAATGTVKPGAQGLEA